MSPFFLTALLFGADERVMHCVHESSLRFPTNLSRRSPAAAARGGQQRAAIRRPLFGSRIAVRLSRAPRPQPGAAVRRNTAPVERGGKDTTHGDVAITRWASQNYEGVESARQKRLSNRLNCTDVRWPGVGRRHIALTRQPARTPRSCVQCPYRRDR